MKGITRKFTLSIYLTVGYCAATFSVAKAGLLLLQHRRCVGSNPDWERAAASVPQLALIFVWQVSDKALDITGNKDVHQAAFVFVRAMEEL